MDRDIDEELLSAKMAKLRRRQRLEYQDLLEYYDSHLSLTCIAALHILWNKRNVFHRMCISVLIQKPRLPAKTEKGYCSLLTRNGLCCWQYSHGDYKFPVSGLSHAKVCDDQVWVEITTRSRDIIWDLSEKEWERWEGDQQNWKYRMNMEWLWQWTCIRG